MRSTNRLCNALTLTVLLASMALQASAETVFYDDFSDGSITNDTPLSRDAAPVRWTELTSGDFDATSGDYVFTPTSSVDFMFSSVVDITLRDVSIRTQVRVSSVEAGAFVTARLQDSLAIPSIGNYFGGIAYNPNNGGTNLILGRNDGGNFTFFRDFADFPVLPFDVRAEDAVLQLDVIGNELKLWGWKAGDPMPDQPQVTATDNTYPEGAMRIVNETRNNNISTFRYVHVADSHITDVPEPTTLMLAILGMAGPYCYRRRR